MELTESCADCLYERQMKRCDAPEYVREVKRLLANRGKEHSAPYLGYLFNQLYKEQIGPLPDYKGVKKEYNDFVLAHQKELRKRIMASADPLRTAIKFARDGNYIDFAAVSDVNADRLMELLKNSAWSRKDQETYEKFVDRCEKAESLLLITDNCGEIVFDRLMVEQLRNRFEKMKITVLVRGGNVVNDATREDAVYVGLDRLAEIIDNGLPVAGTVPELLPPQVLKVLGESDVILSKGQGNFESLSGNGYDAFYLLLCKCELFTNRFRADRFTGIFVEV